MSGSGMCPSRRALRASSCEHCTEHHGFAYVQAYMPLLISLPKRETEGWRGEKISIQMNCIDYRYKMHWVMEVEHFWFFIMSRNDARGQCSFGMLLLHFVPCSFNIWVRLVGTHAFTFHEPLVTAWRYNPVGGGAWVQHRPFCVQLSRPTRGQAFRLQGPITWLSYGGNWLMCIDKIPNKLMPPRPSINQFSSSWLDKKEAHPVPIPWIL